MRALTLQGPGKIELRSDLPEPRLRDERDAIVAVRRAGLCGSDLHPYHGRESLKPGTIPGHEFTGEVVEIGAAVRGFRTGDQVFGAFSTSCGECRPCRDGISARCEQGQLFGYCPVDGDPEDARWLQGAQAEFVRVPLADGTLLPLPDDMSDAQALLLGDNFTTGFHCASQAGLRADGVSVVLGCGAVGLSAVVAARFLGAETIVAVDPIEKRRIRAQQLGAVPATPESAREIVQELASGRGGRGADSVLEAVGGSAAQRLGFELLAPGGTLSAVGVHVEQHFAFSPGAAYDLNMSYRAGRCPVRSILDVVLPLVEEGRLEVPAEELVDSEALPLSEGAAAYRRFADRSGDGRKLLLDPTR